MLRTLTLLVLLGSLTPQCVAKAQTREENVRGDREKVVSDGFWIYNDIDRGFAEARRTGKPLLVVLRCIPCEECVKLDDELVDQDPVIRPLLEQFVCVRQVSTNGLDLSIFQFDTDQSFAVFMLNADKTIYGRFGTRSHRTEWFGDVSLEGMAKALRGALNLHADFPANKAALAGKSGGKPLFPSPEKFPSLKDKYTDSLNYSGNVVKSCIHCHQIGDAQRDYYRSAGRPLPETLVYPYPHPKSVGLILDPQEAATITDVTPDSVAARSGFRPGDVLLTLKGQPLLSFADVQWVLHQTPANGGILAAEVRRDSKTQTLTLRLTDGWRRNGDLSWRVSSWGYRRMTTGGLRLKPLTDEERHRQKLGENAMALRVDHVGQYNQHAAAKRAGFLVDDVLIDFNGQNQLMSESDLFFYALTETKPGESIPVTILRGDRRMTLQLPMQK